MPYEVYNRMRTPLHMPKIFPTNVLELRTTQIRCFCGKFGKIFIATIFSKC